jgi:hypothetical protein
MSGWFNNLCVQAISVLGGITYLLYNEQLKDPFNGSWNEIFKKHPIPFYYCAGIYSNSLACFPWLFLCQSSQQIALQVQCYVPLDCVTTAMHRGKVKCHWLYLEKVCTQTTQKVSVGLHKVTNFNSKWADILKSKRWLLRRVNDASQ